MAKSDTRETQLADGRLHWTNQTLIFLALACNTMQPVDLELTLNHGDN